MSPEKRRLEVSQAASEVQPSPYGSPQQPHPARLRVVPSDPSEVMSPVVPDVSLARAQQIGRQLANQTIGPLLGARAATTEQRQERKLSRQVLEDAVKDFYFPASQLVLPGTQPMHRKRR